MSRADATAESARLISRFAADAALASAPLAKLATDITHPYDRSKGAEYNDERGRVFMDYLRAIYLPLRAVAAETEKLADLLASEGRAE